MKKVIYIPVFLMLLLSACGPSQDQVISVNDLLVAGIAKCSDAEKALFEKCETNDSVAIHNEMKKFKEALIASKAEIEAIDCHKDLANLKAASVSLVDKYIASEEFYKEYARLYSIPNDAFDAEDEKLTAEVTKNINDAIDKSFLNFQTTQNEFAAKYGYEIEKTESLKNN